LYLFCYPDRDVSRNFEKVITIMKKTRLFCRKIEIRSKPKWKRRCCYAHEGELCSRKGRQLEKVQLTDGTEGWIESNY
jgi:hypothetical protein